MGVIYSNEMQAYQRGNRADEETGLWKRIMQIFKYFLATSNICIINKVTEQLYIEERRMKVCYGQLLLFSGSYGF